MALGEINTSTFFQSATKVIHKIYSNELPKVNVLYPKVFTEVDNDTRRAFMTLQPIVELGTLALKPEGAGPKFDQSFEGVPTTFNFVTYSLAYKITREAQHEDPKMLLKSLPGMLAYGEQITKELLFWQILNLAFSATSPIFDGQPLISAVHPLGGGTQPLYGTYSNSLGATSLTPESWQNAEIQLQATVSDRGLPTQRTPRKLIVPLNLEKIGKEVLGSEYAPYTSDNRINTAYGAAELIASRYLTSNTAWFASAANSTNISGDCHSMLVSFKWQNRTDEWVDDATGNINQRTEFRGTWGPVSWRGLSGSTGS